MIWIAVDDLVPFWWRIIEALPFPKTLSLASSLSWYVAIAFYVVVALLAAILNHRSFRLKEAATKAEERLAFHAPLLMQMSAAAASSQSINIGNVAGETITISAANAVTQVIRDAEEKKWYERPWGLVLIGVAIASASKLLHLT